MAEHLCEVGLAICHRCEQSFHHTPVAGVAAFDADFRGEPFLQCVLIETREVADGGLGFIDRFLRSLLGLKAIQSELAA